MQLLDTMGLQIKSRVPVRSYLFWNVDHLSSIDREILQAITILLFTLQNLRVGLYLLNILG